MLQNYMKIALRNLLKNRVHSIVNITGLAVAIASSLLLFTFAEHELSFDRFHPDHENIYRVNEIQSLPGITPQKVALTMYPLAAAMKDEYPQVLETARTWRIESLYMTMNDKEVFLEKPRHVDQSYLQLFEFGWIAGDRQQALTAPNSIVLTRQSATKLAGNQENFDGQLIGSQLKVNDSTYYQITGIVETPPSQSHLQFDALISISTFDSEDRRDSWGSNYVVSYIKVVPGTDIAALEATFPAFLSKYAGDDTADIIKLFLQPFSDIHLGSSGITHDYQNAKKFNRTYITIFLLISGLILLIAAINFMNLSTAQSAIRAREIGIRKTIGAHRRQLAAQFLGESLLLTIIAAFLALGLAELSLPWLNNLSDRTLSLDLLGSPSRLALMAAVIVGYGLLAGLYPAMILSSFKPSSVLKGSLPGAGGSSRRNKGSLRNALIVSQFAITIALIVGTLIALQQLHYIRGQELGFNKDQVLLIPMNQTANQQYETLKNELQRLSSVQGVTASWQRLGNNFHQMGSRFEGSEEHWSLSHNTVDFNFLSFYGINLIAGREFSPEVSSDKGSAYIINEKLAKKLGWEEPVGKGAKLAWLEEMGTVIGVMEDFHFNSLHHQIEPMMLSIQDWSFDELSLRISMDDPQQTIADIGDVWRRMVPDRPFEYTFLNDHINDLYRNDQQAGTTIALIAGLAIIIACMGLFGLSSIVTLQRTKEIGIRKVLGASPGGLIAMLCKQFALLIVVAFLLSVPFSWWLMNNWLQDFAYRISIGVGVFVFAGLAALAVGLLTVSYHALRTVQVNPVRALRYE